MISLFTFYLPIVILIIWLLIFILNYFFYEYRSTLYKLITRQSTTVFYLNKITIHTVLPDLMLVFNVYNVFIFYICLTYNNFNFLNLNSLVMFQLFILNIIFNILLVFFISLKKIPLNIDFIMFFFFLIMVSQTLVLFNNLLNIFFILEITNILIIYSFINSITLRTYHIKNNYSVFWLIESCIYQFILNFIGSLLFYFFYNHLIINYYSTNLFTLSILSNFTNSFFAFNGLYISFLVKFGIGPWLVYKVHMYKHFNVILLIIYTVVYFLTILMFFLNLFILYKFNLSIFFIYTTTFIVLLVFYFILVFLFTYTNLLVFISLSSLLNFILIITQLVFILN